MLAVLRALTVERDRHLLWSDTISNGRYGQLSNSADRVEPTDTRIGAPDQDRLVARLLSACQESTNRRSRTAYC